MRTSYDCTQINFPRTIAGVEWRIVVIAVVFFGSAAAMYRLPGLLIAPAFILFFLRGPGKRDPEFLRIYRRHRAQRSMYSPAYVALRNDRAPRPDGFGRGDTF